jgi:uncharacterized protein (UPF0332 family)
MNDLVRQRLEQAKASLEEAAALRAAGMDIGFILSELYYAFYYPVVALVYEGSVPSAMQSVTIGLFEQRFVRTDVIAREYFDAIRRIFDLKPKCGGEGVSVSSEEIDRLSDQARSFLEKVSAVLAAPE